MIWIMVLSKATFMSHIFSMIIYKFHKVVLQNPALEKLL